MASTRSVLAVVVLLMLAAPAMAQSAVADLRTTSGESIASVSLTQTSREVQIAIAFRNRTALVGTHAVQVHAIARCDRPSFDTAGTAVLDLPSLVIGPAGVGVYNLSAPSTTFAALQGKSLIVLDDAGARIACAIIGEQAEATDRPDPMTSLGIAAMGVLLIAGGVWLRRGA